MECHTRTFNATNLHYMGLKKTGQGLFLGGASRPVPLEKSVAVLISERGGRWCILKSEETACWRNAVMIETHFSTPPQ